MPSIVGTWQMNYSWGCTTSYASIASLVFNADGTWTTNVGQSGKWVQNQGMLIFNTDGSATGYAGNIAGNAMLGISTTFDGKNGCWYAIRGGVKAAASKGAAAKAPRVDFAGNKSGRKSASKKSSKKK